MLHLPFGRCLPRGKKVKPPKLMVMSEIRAGDISVRLIWFDSMGAKSSSFLVSTPDISILVDPGAAEMQGSYPLPSKEKRSLRMKALQAILEASRDVDTIFISHYHYDHHTLPEEAPELYRGKRLWVKDPNKWICRSQWRRARKFLNELLTLRGESLENSKEAQGFDFPDPIGELPLALGREYRDYQQRKEELLRKGREAFLELASFWRSNPWVKEGKGILFVDGLSFKFGSTFVRFTKPLFHGLEYTGLGWVIGLVVEFGGAKVLYTSDLQGPTIEDYAQWVISENPSLLIIDGPPTYLFGYMVNRINLERSIANMCRILEEVSSKVIVYDHHLLREPKFRERTKVVWETAAKRGLKLLTAAEILGEEPLILRLSKGDNAYLQS